MTDGNDELAEWVSDNQSDLLLKTEFDKNLMNKVLKDGYKLEKPSLEDLDKIGGDYKLIAHALSAPKERTVITNETSNKATGANRKIPDVCKELGIPCSSPWVLNKKLDFKA